MALVGYDAAFLPDPAPTSYAFAGGYVGGAGAANVWTLEDWQRAAGNSRYLLPIQTTWGPPFPDPAVEAANAIRLWEMLFPKQEGTAFALDIEAEIAQAAHDAGYIDRWRTELTNAGYYAVVYSSRSTAPLLGAGPKWIAFGTLGGDVVAIQTGQALGGAIDTDEALDTVPFYDTQHAPARRPHRMFQLFKISDATTPATQAAVWVLDGMTRRWVTTPAERDLLIVVAQTQGLPTNIASFTSAQVANIPVLAGTAIPQ